MWEQVSFVRTKVLLSPETWKFLVSEPKFFHWPMVTLREQNEMHIIVQPQSQKKQEEATPIPSLTRNKLEQFQLLFECH